MSTVEYSMGTVEYSMGTVEYSMGTVEYSGVQWSIVCSSGGRSSGGSTTLMAGEAVMTFSSASFNLLHICFQ
jgi:hypothetical protein